MTHMTENAGIKLTKLIVMLLVCMLFVVAYVFYSGYQGRKDLVTSQRAGCERGKLDRIDNAKFQKAHRKYINKVVLAKSVEEDVKEAAREAVMTYNKTAKRLSKRSKINCQLAIPKASLIP